AERHAFERPIRHGKQLRISRGLKTFEQQIDGTGVRKLRRVTKASMPFVELTQGSFDHRIHHTDVKYAARALKNLRLGDSFLQRLRGIIHFTAAAFESLGNGLQNTLQTRPAAGVLGRKIGTAEKRLTIRSEKSRERPAALSGNRAHGGLVARVHVGTLVAIHLYGNVKLIDGRRDFRIFVAFAINYMAPMAPHRADIKQDGFGFGTRFLKRLLAPFVPVNRLMRGRTQVRARGILEPVLGPLRHNSNLSHNAKACGVSLNQLLDRIAVAGIARIDWLAAGEALVLSMVETNAVFAKAPAQINILAVHARGKIQQTYLNILHDASGGMNLLDGCLNNFRKPIAFQPAPGGFFIGN